MRAFTPTVRSGSRTPETVEVRASVPRLTVATSTGDGRWFARFPAPPLGPPAPGPPPFLARALPSPRASPPQAARNVRSGSIKKLRRSGCRAITPLVGSSKSGAGYSRRQWAERPVAIRATGQQRSLGGPPNESTSRRESGPPLGHGGAGRGRHHCVGLFALRGTHQPKGGVEHHDNHE